MCVPSVGDALRGLYQRVPTSCPRVNAIMVISEVQRHRTSDTTPVRADALTIASTVRTGAEEDATRATAIPEAVTIVFATSTYIVRLASVVQFHSRAFASRQKVQMK